jgi:hypothetical protein
MRKCFGKYNDCTMSNLCDRGEACLSRAYADQFGESAVKMTVDVRRYANYIRERCPITPQEYQEILSSTIERRKSGNRSDNPDMQMFGLS